MQRAVGPDGVGLQRGQESSGQREAPTAAQRQRDSRGPHLRGPHALRPPGCHLLPHGALPTLQTDPEVIKVPAFGGPGASASRSVCSGWLEATRPAQAPPGAGAATKRARLSQIIETSLLQQPHTAMPAPGLRPAEPYKEFARTSPPSTRAARWLLQGSTRRSFPLLPGHGAQSPRRGQVPELGRACGPGVGPAAALTQRTFRREPGARDRLGDIVDQPPNPST